MVIIHVMGGLGNQLYQYAMYEKLKSLGREVKLDLYAYEVPEGHEDREWRKLELAWLDGVSYEVCTPEERTLFLDNSMALRDRIRRKLTGRKNRTLREIQDYMPELFQADEVYLYGYWTCERYYEDIIPLLQKKIRFPKSQNLKNQETMEKMRLQQSVSIHIRRQDYLTVADGKRYMGICTEEYYKAAMQYVETRIAEPVYYIFSDDAEYAREHFRKENMHIVDWNHGEDSMYDMQLMSCCQHNICANSTFSMWGARLNPNPDKIMIRPLHADNYETTTAREIQENWKKWILINPKGEIE